MLSTKPTSDRLRPARLSLRLLLVAAGVLMAACGGGTQLAGDVTKGEAPGPAVKVEAGDNFFKPDVLALRPAEEATVEIRNTGNTPHDWTADELGISTGVMSPGEVYHATFTVPGRDVKFVCTLHAGMDGSIRVSR